jgi:hypothetical protein
MTAHDCALLVTGKGGDDSFNLIWFRRAAD